MKRVTIAGALLVAAALVLTGCGETLEERAANRDKCEALGGTYVEMINGFDYSYRDWRFDLKERDGEKTGWVYVDEATFSDYEVGQTYP